MIWCCMLDVVLVERALRCLVSRASFVMMCMIILSVGLNVIVCVMPSLVYAWSRMALRVVGSVYVGIRLKWTFGLVFWL